MLTKPSPKAVKALHALKLSGHWAEISEYIESELSKVYDVLVSSPDEVTLRQMQGRAQALRDFMVMVRDAHKTLERLRETTL